MRNVAGTSGDLPFTGEAIDLSLSCLTDPSESNYIDDVVAASSLLALEHGGDRLEDGELRTVQAMGQNIGVRTEVLDIRKQFDGGDLHEDSEG